MWDRMIVEIGGIDFRLQNVGWATCAVNYEGGFVTVGGYFPTHGKVDRWNSDINQFTSLMSRYNSKGVYHGSLPDLLEARYSHACTSFTSSNGEKVQNSC